MVLVYSLHAATNRGTPVSLDVQNAYILVNGATEFYVSAITWFEIHRNINVAQQAVLQRLTPKVKIAAVDVPVAVRAARITNAARAAEALCPKCGTVKAATACVQCGVNRSTAQRLNDILILATACTHFDVSMIYTFDAGMLALAPFASDIQVLRPGTFSLGPAPP